jgi:hypothetical protein
MTAEFQLVIDCADPWNVDATRRQLRRVIVLAADLRSQINPLLILTRMYQCVQGGNSG